MVIAQFPLEVNWKRKCEAKKEYEDGVNFSKAK